MFVCCIILISNFFVHQNNFCCSSRLASSAAKILCFAVVVGMSDNFLHSVVNKTSSSKVFILNSIGNESASVSDISPANTLAMCVVVLLECSNNSISNFSALSKGSVVFFFFNVNVLTQVMN